MKELLIFIFLHKNVKSEKHSSVDLLFMYKNDKNGEKVADLIISTYIGKKISVFVYKNVKI